MNGPHPPHTRGTFHRQLQPLYTEKHQVSFSGFLPKLTPMQHSCSYYNAFCSITSLTRISLRTLQHNMKTIMQTLLALPHSLSLVSHFSWLCDCKLAHHPSLSIVSHFSWLCDVKSHTTLHWVKVIRNSEDCFPTSFDYIVLCILGYIMLYYII